jgi:tetratricopeptide (TPR) repeat protein
MSIAIFYSYAQADLDLLVELDTRLIMLKRKKLITVWSAQMVEVGQDRAREIDMHLKAAQVLLLFITQAYIADEECYAQLLRAVELAQKDDVVVLPVIARPTADLESTPLHDLMVLPTNGKPIVNWESRDLAYNNVASGIRRVVENMQPVQHIKQPIIHNLKSLPLDSRVIYPRASLVQEVYRRLIQGNASALVLTGMGGIGKSALAALVFQYAEEQRLAGRGPFTADTLHFKLDSAAILVDLIGVLSQALGKPILDYANLTAHDQVLELFNLLYQCDAPRLILLDQFDEWLDAQTGAVRPERAGVDEWLDTINGQLCRSRLLLTSRIWPQGAHIYQSMCMQEFPVPGLQKDEGIALLRQRGMQGSAVDLALAVERCRGLPQALVLLDKLWHDSGLIKLAVLLNDPGYRQLWIDNVARNLFDYIYGQQLNASQRDLLFAFSIYRVPVPRRAVQMTTQNQVPQEQLMAALKILQARGLILRQGASEGRYELHPIIAEYARKRFLEDAGRTNSDALRKAHSQAAQYYLHQFSLTTQPRQRWRIEDVQYLIEAIWHYCQSGQQQAAYDLIIKEHIFRDLQRWGRNTVLLELYISFLPSTSWQPAPEQAGRIYNEIGDIYDDLGQKDKARQYFEKAIVSFKQSGLRQGEVKALINLGAMYRAYGQIEQALTYYQEAMHICDESKEEIPDKGILLHNIGKAYQSLGERERTKSSQNDHYTLALEYYKQALFIHETTKNSAGEARTRHNIGEVYAAMGQYEQARQYYEQALDLFLELGDRRGEGIVYSDLGVLQRELSRMKAAFEYYTQALAIFREIGDRWQEATVLKNLGRLFVFVDRFDVALACFLLATEIADAIHKNTDAEPVPRWVRASLTTEEFELYWSQAEAHAAQIVDQAIHDGITVDDASS